MLLALLGLALGSGLQIEWRGARAEIPATGSLTDGTEQIRVGVLGVVAGVELGPERAKATPYVDFHSSGTAGLDYDARLIGSGGDGSVGGGDLRAASTRFLVDGTLKAGRQTAGQGDRGAVATFIANSSRPGQGGPAGVLGYKPGLDAATYGDIDSVAVYTQTTGRDPFFVVDRATLAVTGDGARVLMPPDRPLSSGELVRLFVGMQILTNHRPAWTGWIESWDPAGHWVKLIGGFTHLHGSKEAGQNPAAGPLPPEGAPVQVAFAPLTKVWLEDANCYLGVDTLGRRLGPFAPKSCAGYELGMLNNTGRDQSWRGLADPAGYSWGFDAVNLGQNRASSAHIARGNWDVGFHAQVAGHFGFLAEGGGPGDGYVSTRTGGLAFAVRPGDGAAAPVWSVDAAGAMQAAQLVLPDLPGCDAERRPGHVCRRGRVLEVN
jgi:hypothetical protein